MRKDYRSRRHIDGYEIYLGSSCQQHKLRPIPKKTKVVKAKQSKSKITFRENPLAEEVICPNNIYKDFMKILHPLYDYDGGKNKHSWVEVIDHQSNKFNEEVFKNYCEAVLEFFNTYGYFNDKPIESLAQFITKIRNPVLSYEKYLALRENSVKRFLCDALTIEESYEAKLFDEEDFEEMLEEVLLGYEATLDYKDKEWRVRTTDTMSSIWYSFAFQEDYFEFNNCLHCGAPCVHRKSTKFCQLPRQCKNKYFNSLRGKGEK